MEVVTFQIPIHDPFLAVLAGGTIIGAGASITFHSLGSLGGNDIVAILMKKSIMSKWGPIFLHFSLDNTLNIGEMVL
jgi:uncharacterized membrane-anchored protein YitT (DUF2179 family)